ncbi:MAG: hypothetical protein IJT83_03930 [Victivallales bacterium]|nr:hypothetical protein [Victivallales bacterium]
MKEWLKQMALRLVGFRRDAEGFVLMSTLAIFLLLFVFCASIYAIGETIHQRVKLQNACDAAAYSAAVIQADGLSRMAAINRAMSWTYVQMTNRQMDYVTYRWLRLTCNQFQEDLDNAKKFSKCLIIPLDKEVTWVGMIVEAFIGLGVQSVLNLFGQELACTGQGGHTHHGEGLAYWCGRDGGVNHGKLHEIELNDDPPDFDLSLSGAFETATNALIQRWINKDNIEGILNLLSPLLGNNAENLGLLIDYDKLNIERMNKALPMVNEMMTLSMKVSSENILKAALKDRRLEDEDILKDYHISIKIPHATNPYNVDEVTEATNSYYSALHNTEADEMLFLNMQSCDNAVGSLPSHFPVLFGGGHAYGLDQWFIRGRGIYENSDNETACYLWQRTASYKDGKSGWVNDEGVRLKATERSDGNGGLDLGIQRVYKDANLNETKAGSFTRTKEHKRREVWVRRYSIKYDAIYRGEVPDSEKRYNGVSNGEYQAYRYRLNQILEETKEYIKQNFPECCQNAAQYSFTRTNTRSAHTYYVRCIIPKHGGDASHSPVSRGNHIVNLMGLVDTVQAIAESFGKGEGEGDGGDDDDDGDDFSDLSDFEGKIGELDKEIASLQGEIDLLQNDPEIKVLQGKLKEDPENQDLRRQLQAKEAERDAKCAELQRQLQEKQAYRDEQQAGLERVRNTRPGENAGSASSGTGGTSGTSGTGAIGGTSGGGTAENNQASDGGFFAKLKSFVADFASAMLGDVLDVQASCGNNHTQDYTKYPMCSSASDNYALYSQYRWGAAKWYCLTTMKAYLVCIFKGDNIWCDWSRCKKSILGRHVKIRGKGHWHIPKWFCASGVNDPLEQASIISGYELPPVVEKLGKAAAEYFIPAPLPDSVLHGRRDLVGPMHGYMEYTGDGEHLLWPFGQFTGSVSRIERDKFQSCVPFFGVPSSVTPVGAAYASVIQGHARIYADDKRIFDNRYVGAKCKPWVLNERFFSWDGTIVVGAAMKHRNPFVQLFDFLNREYTKEQNLPEYSMLSAFNIPNGNVMWTMSASRAGVRRHRRDGLYDQARQYQITYDSTCDVENLEFSGGKGPYYFNPGSGQKGSWMPINKTSTSNAWECDTEKNPLALSRPDIKGQEKVAVWNGCPCTGGNSESFKSMWSLCEWDWDATLLPLRYAGVHARLQLVEEKGRPMSFAGKSLDKLCYNDRRKAIKEMREMSDASRKLKSDKLKELAENDDYFGDGRHWVWDAEELIGLQFSWDRDPFLVSTWKEANSTFFEDATAAAAQGLGNAGASYLNNSYQGPDLVNRLPRIKKGTQDDAEWRYMLLLRSNRIL